MLYGQTPRRRQFFAHPLSSHAFDGAMVIGKVLVIRAEHPPPNLPAKSPVNCPQRSVYELEHEENSVSFVFVDAARERYDQSVCTASLLFCCFLLRGNAVWAVRLICIMLFKLAMPKLCICLKRSMALNSI